MVAGQDEGGKYNRRGAMTMATVRRLPEARETACRHREAFLEAPS